MKIDRNDTIGERVRFYRTSQARSLEYVCSKLPTDIGVQQMSRYETGQSRWPADLLVEISILLKVDIRVLTGLEDTKATAGNSPEWHAEKYKCIMLELPERARLVIYKLIEGMAMALEDVRKNSKNTR